MNLERYYQLAMDIWPTEDDCTEYLERLRWGGVPVCPYCSSERSYRIISRDPGRHRLRWTCLQCNRSYSVRVGTMLENKAMPLRASVALMAAYSEARPPRPVAGAATLGVNYRTFVRMTKAILDAINRSDKFFLAVRKDFRRLARAKPA